MLDLTGDLNRRARGLTADAKQKISLGRGLVRSDVSAVLFDEPLTVIDPALKWELRSKLKAVHRALDLLMIYVTHDQIEALTFADKVVVMNDGKAVQIGTPDDLFERPEHTFVGYFIGSPGMNLIAGESLGLARPRRRRGASTGRSLPGAAERPSACRSACGPITPHCRRMAGVPVQVRRVADLGRKRLAYVDSGRTADRRHHTARDVFASATRRNVVFDPAHTHVYVDDVRVDGSGGMTDKPINNRAWFFVLPVLAFVLFSSIIPVDDRGELLDPGHDGREQLLLERRRLVSRSAESRAPKSAARFERRPVPHPRLLARLPLVIEVPLGIAMRSVHAATTAGRSGFSLVIMALPMLIPWNVVGTMWQIFTRADIGLFGAALTGLGLHYNVTQDAVSAWVTIVVIDVWHWTPLVILLSYAGLRAIPDAYYQAARIDGASRWAVFRQHRIAEAAEGARHRRAAALHADLHDLHRAVRRDRRRPRQRDDLPVDRSRQDRARPGRSRQRRGDVARLLPDHPDGLLGLLHDHDPDRTPEGRLTRQGAPPEDHPLRSISWC